MFKNAFVGAGEYFIMEFHDPGTVGNDAPSVNAQFLDSVTLNVSLVMGGGGWYQWTAVNSLTGITETGTVFITSKDEDASPGILINPNISFNKLTISGSAEIQGQGRTVLLNCPCGKHPLHRGQSLL